MYKLSSFVLLDSKSVICYNCSPCCVSMFQLMQQYNLLKALHLFNKHKQLLNIFINWKTKNIYGAVHYERAVQAWNWGKLEILKSSPVLK